MSKWCLTRLDLVAAVAGIITLILLIPWLVCRGFHPIYLVTVAVGLGSIVVYLLVGRRTSRNDSIDNRNDSIDNRDDSIDNRDDNPTSNNKALSWQLLAVAILLCLSAWLSFASRTEQYIKPTAYYVLMACATGAAFYGILKSEGKLQTCVVVGTACFIGLSHIWTEHLLFPGSLIGLDPWTHQTTTIEHIGQPGHPSLSLSMLGGHYSLMHMYLQSAMNTFGLSYKWASLVFVGSVQTVGIVLLTFLLGRMLWNTKAGCIAGLVVASANWVIFFGEWIIPNTMGAVYSLLIACLLLKIKRGSTNWLLAPVALLVLTAYTTHFMAVIWVLGTLACLWVMPALLRITDIKTKIRELTKLSAVPLLEVLLLVFLLHFTVVGGAIQETVGEGIFSPGYGMTYAVGLVPDSQTGIEIPGEITSTEGGQSLLAQDGGVMGEMTLNSAGMLLYFGLAVIGCLMLLRRTTTPAHKAFCILSLTVLAIGFFPPLFNLSVIEHRWWYFAEVLLAVPLGIALVSLASTRCRRAVLSVLVVAMVFLSTIGWMSNMTNLTLSPNLIARYAFTEGETESLVVALQYSPQTIGTDPMFSPFVRANTDSTVVKTVSLTDEILSGDFQDRRVDILLLRDALHEEPFGFGGGTIYKLDYDLVALAVQQGYYTVWENGEVTCLLRQ